MKIYVIPLLAFVSVLLCAFDQRNTSNGYKVKGKNGNSILLLATGFYRRMSLLYTTSKQEYHNHAEIYAKIIDQKKVDTVDRVNAVFGD